MSASSGHKRHVGKNVVDGAIDCEWHPPETPTSRTRLVRVIADDCLWRAHTPNLAKQRRFIADVQQFVANNTRARLIVFPAGTVAIPLSKRPIVSAAGLAAVLVELERSAAMLRFAGRPAAVVGLDGVIPGRSAPVQLLTLVDGSGVCLQKNTAVKMYPSAGEDLLGWQLLKSDSLSANKIGARVVRTQRLSLGMLVCHEVAAFSARSVRARTADGLRAQLARWFQRSFQPPPDFIVSALHSVTGSPRSASALRNGMRRLSDSTGVIVIPSMFAPRKDLATVADNCDVIRNQGAVATLLVRSHTTA